MSERAPTAVGIDERLAVIDERLQHGNRSHAEYRERLDRLERRGEERAKTLLGWVLGFAFAIAGWAYSVSTKPNSEEVRRICRVESEYTQDKDRIMRVVDRYDRDGESVREALEAIRLEMRTAFSKLDTLLRAVSQRKR